MQDSRLLTHAPCNIRNVSELTHSRRDWITFGRALAMIVASFLAGGLVVWACLPH
jgi:hypothetical protein